MAPTVALNPEPSKKPRFLLAMDFDNTLISHSAKVRICVEPLFPGGRLPKALAEEAKTSWDSFVRSTYRALHALGTVGRADIERQLRQQPMIEGMAELVEWAADNGGEVIIISDAYRWGGDLTVHGKIQCALAFIAKFF